SPPMNRTRFRTLSAVLVAIPILTAPLLAAPGAPGNPAAHKEVSVTTGDNVLHTSNGDVPVPGYDSSKQYVGIIDTDQGKIVVEFWPDVAPNHVKNFISLAKKGYYNGV